MGLNRREALNIIAASYVSFSGCAEITSDQQVRSPNSSNGYMEDNDSSRKEAQCLQVNLSEEYDIFPEQTDFLELSCPSDIQLGEEFTITLTNISTESQIIGVKEKYAIQRMDNNSWVHIFSIPENYSWPDSGVTIPPEKGYTWDFVFSPDGLSNDPYLVCKNLSPGKYRFIYWGLGDGRAIECRFHVLD